jgi:hypothetical protein
MQWQKLCYTLYPKLKKLLRYGLAKNADQLQGPPKLLLNE